MAVGQKERDQRGADHRQRRGCKKRGIEQAQGFIQTAEMLRQPDVVDRAAGRLKPMGIVEQADMQRTTHADAVRITERCGTQDLRSIRMVVHGADIHFIVRDDITVGFDQRNTAIQRGTQAL